MRGKTRFIILLCFLFLCVERLNASPHTQPPEPVNPSKIIFVDDDAAGVNDGSSWESAFNDLQDALTVAQEGDEIRVARGIYFPTQDPLDRDATFELKDGVVIKGGYAGFDEPDPNVRDIELYESILSGDINDDDVAVSDPCDLLNERTRLDNCYTIVAGSNTDETAVLDGFTVTGGHATGIVTMGPPPGGAGMHISHGSPTLINCTFTDNAADVVGGGLYNLSGSPTLINCTFTRNYAGRGAGMCNFPAWQSSQVSNPTLINCTFDDNYAQHEGGGMSNASSNPILTDCTFGCNSTPGLGAGIANSNSNLTLTNCEFIENSGGNGGGIYSEDNCSLKMTTCTFYGNLASLVGGGVCNEDINDIILIGCKFYGNIAVRAGGGILNSRSESTLTNCIFAGNKTYGEPWPYTGEGGGMFVFGDATLNSCIFRGNWARQGCAISKYSLSNLIIVNSILWDGGDEIVNGNSSRTKITYSNVQGGWPGEGNIYVDPLFANPGCWVSSNDPNQIVEPVDPNAMWVDGDYHLKSQAGRWDPINESWVIDDVTSPCIDAGDPNSPVGDEPFPNGGRINMGAYGGTSEASMSL